MGCSADLACFTERQQGPWKEYKPTSQMQVGFYLRHICYVSLWKCLNLVSLYVKIELTRICLHSTENEWQVPARSSVWQVLSSATLGSHNVLATSSTDSRTQSRFFTSSSSFANRGPESLRSQADRKARRKWSGLPLNPDKHQCCFIHSL